MQLFQILALVGAAAVAIAGVMAFRARRRKAPDEPEPWLRPGGVVAAIRGGIKTSKIEITEDGRKNYACPVCGTQHTYTGDFVVCCLSPSFDMWKCGQCDELYFNQDRAKECCGGQRDESKVASVLERIDPEGAKMRVNNFIEWFNMRARDESCLKDAEKQREHCGALIRDIEGTLVKYRAYRKFLDGLIDDCRN